ATAPEDALPYLVRDRDLIASPLEDPASLRQRLAAAFEIHTWAGTVHGLELAMLALGYTARVVEHWHAEPAAWSEFSLYLTPTGFNRPARRWGEPGLKWGDQDAYWGLSLADAPRIRAVVKKLKPSHTKLRAAFFVIGNGPGDVWNAADGTWNDGTTWGYLIPLP
ncbi:MAG TPA: phage tail protein, partial [Deinococcales bacterium]|nr:phage tail protein [Deinococcales bacterium]